jgi:hypothetical protein
MRNINIDSVLLIDCCRISSEQFFKQNHGENKLICKQTTLWVGLHIDVLIAINFTRDKGWGCANFAFPTKHLRRILANS